MHPLDLEKMNLLFSPDVIRAEERKLIGRKLILLKLPQENSIFKMKIQQKLVKFQSFKTHIFLESLKACLTLVFISYVVGWCRSQTPTEPLAHSHN